MWREESHWFPQEKNVIKLRITFTDSTRKMSVPGGIAVIGLEVPFDRLGPGDLMTDRLKSTQEHLSRIMGLQVKIETAE